MVLPNSLILGCVVVGVATTVAIVYMDKRGLSMMSGLVTGQSEVSKFQRIYLAAYLTAMMGDWLQGPFVYALYESYGFSREDNAALFVAGFGSSAVFGTFIGSLADKYGRKKFALLYCVLYIISCMTKHVNSFSFLMVGRITGGIATSLLFSVFDAWLVSEHNSRHFEGDQLGATFSLAIFGNSLVAISAGEVGQLAADAKALTPLVGSVYYGGYTGPFDVANIFLAICLGLLLVLWPENYGQADSKAPSESIGAGFAKAVQTIMAQPMILYCGVVCSFFEASMFIFVFNWTPCLMEEGQPPPPFGHIFAAFMIMSMLGSRLFAFLSQSMPVERVGLLTLCVAALCHMTIIVISSVVLRLFAFLVFEMCVGLYFPMMGTLKGQIVPEEMRSTIYNLFRLPMNAAVLLTLILKLSTATSFCVTSLLLVVACLAQLRLSDLRGAYNYKDYELAQVSGDLEPAAATLGALAIEEPEARARRGTTSWRPKSELAGPWFV